MPRKNEYGKYIIPAGEIAAYTVCPEAWRLSVMKRVSSGDQARSRKGDSLHQEWAKKYGETVSLSKYVRLVLLLILLCLACAFLYAHGR